MERIYFKIGVIHILSIILGLMLNRTEEERKKTTDEKPHTGKPRVYTSSVARTSGRGTDEDPRHR